MKVWFVAVVLALTAVPAVAQPQGEFFESRIRPLLVEKCQSCHGAKKSQGGLKLDSREAVLTGGDSGPAAVGGDPAKSLLLRAVRQTGDLKMPPKGKLTDREIADLEEWVRLGLPGPAIAKLVGPVKELWSLKPVANPTPPAVKDASWPRQPLDRFILAKLESSGLKPTGRADRRTLIRRVTFDLTGLPPTPDEIEAFLNDRSTNAYEKLIDRLLTSPAYGERWGRHWLDLVRYCDSFDSRGIGGEGDCADAWRYRDWVVKALNADLPYDQFVRRQIAGDILPLPESERADGIVATGMLAIGNWGGGDADKEKLLTDIVDDQVDVIGRTMLGLTLACARCHDHKFDPVSTKDYYGLAGIFFSTHILPNVGPKTGGPPMLRIPLEMPVLAKAPVGGTVLAKRFASVAGKAGLFSWRGEPDCPNLLANTGSDGKFGTITMPPRSVAIHPGPTTDVAVVWTSPIAGAVTMTGRLSDFDANCGDGIAWELRQVPAKGDPKSIRTGTLGNGKSERIDPPVTATIAVNDRLELIVKRNGEYTCDTTGVEFALTQGETKWDFAADWLTKLPDGAARLGVWSVVEFGVPTPPAGPMANGAQEGGVPGSPHAGIHDVRVHIRGRYDRLGELVPRQFPDAIGLPNAPTIGTGSGRLELAAWLTRPDHPLTARVIVNRVWQYHFGEGLVRTPSNFGALGEAPTHPELLDHLASTFVADGWSLKKLHRSILTSATYLQSATADAKTLAVDPDNRVWGRFSRRRLEAEAIRDSLLAVGGKLDLAARGGPSIRDFASPKRTLYLTSIRSDRTGFGPLFDAADTTAPVDKRTVSTVAPQALFLMNHPFVLAQARAFADRVLSRPEPERLEYAHRLAFGRAPSNVEMDLGKSFVKDGGRDAWITWCHILMQSNEFVTIE